jgi:hypothetical protein
MGTSSESRQVLCKVGTVDTRHYCVNVPLMDQVISKANGCKGHTSLGTARTPLSG